jgi:uncharacterized membrane protein
MDSLLALYSIGGIVLIALAIPLTLQKIKPNSFYGFRVSETLNDEKIWYAVNRFGAKRLIITGLATIAAAFMLYPLGLGVDAYAILVTIIFGITFALGLFETYRYMKQTQT